MAIYEHLSHGFDPVFDSRSRVLVLGSFPSVLSRENDFYYGNPRNRFWAVMASCLRAPEPQTVAEKKELLLAHGVALWDAIEECDIKGSSDASIKNVVPAHVERVLEAAPIGAVLCNGGAAGRLYKRFLQWKTGVPARVLPSTSPANASWSLERLCARWSDALGELPPLPADALLAAEPAPADALLAAGPAPAPSAKGRAPLAASYAVHRSMQGNKGKNTKPELLVRRRLREAGLTGYRLQWKVPGRPDVAWPGKRVALFVNGCFWHRCPHCKPAAPRTNAEYWTAKFERNVARDRRNVAELEAAGWKVHVVWECQLKKGAADQTFSLLLPLLAEELDKPLAPPPVHV